MNAIYEALSYVNKPTFPVPGIKNVVIKCEETGILDAARYASLEWSRKPMGWIDKNGVIVREKEGWENLLDIIDGPCKEKGIEVFFVERPAEDCECVSLSCFSFFLNDR